MKNSQYFFAILRFALGWMLIWAFLDKTFGLGFATAPENSWLAGGSPTTGFLTHATKGPLAEFYQTMAGNPLVDWIFMLGLLLIGLCFILGVGLKIAGYSAAVLFFSMYTAIALPPENNPLLDEHILYVIISLGFAHANAGDTWGLGKWWGKTKLVKKWPVLK